MTTDLDNQRPAESYARLYDDVLDNEKMVAAGPLAFALYCAGLVYTHHNLTDGRIHQSKARTLLDLPKPDEVIAALVKYGLWERDGDYLVIHDYLKHNPSREQRLAAKQKARAAGLEGAQRRWGHRPPDSPPHSHIYKEGHTPPDALPDRQPHSKGDGSPNSKVKVKAKEKGLVLTAPPFPPTGGSDAVKEDSEPGLVELATGLAEVLNTSALAMSAVDLATLQAALNQYQYLRVSDLIQRAIEHQDYCQDHDLPPARTVAGFADAWRRENDWRADQGHAKVTRILGPSRHQGMTRLGDGLPATPAAKEASA